MARLLLLCFNRTPSPKGPIMGAQPKKAWMTARWSPSSAAELRRVCVCSTIFWMQSRISESPTQALSSQYVYRVFWYQELFGACGNIRDGAAKVGLNMLTKALARSVIGDDEQECRIDFMRAIYVVDGEGALWFSHASDVRVWPSMKPVEDSGANLVLPAHQLVKSELKRALIRAINSGASIEELFTHFDPFKRG